MPIGCSTAWKKTQQKASLGNKDPTTFCFFTFATLMHKVQTRWKMQQDKLYWLCSFVIRHHSLSFLIIPYHSLPVLIIPYHQPYQSLFSLSHSFRFLQWFLPLAAPTSPSRNCAAACANSASARQKALQLLSNSAPAGAPGFHFALWRAPRVSVPM